ncbi:cytochrome b/b6 domain-containing protein [Thalassotalea agariperforans]
MTIKIDKTSNLLIGWDWLVRLTHWSVAVLFLTNYYLTEKGSENHEYVGWTLLGLIVTRLLWGVTLAAGPNRLSAFVPNVTSVKQHFLELKTRKAEKGVGHNPFGAIAIYLMWAGLISCSLTGWGMDTDWGFENDVDQWHEFAVDFTFAIVCVHVSAVTLVSFWLRKNLIKAMVVN